MALITGTTGPRLLDGATSQPHLSLFGTGPRSQPMFSFVPSVPSICCTCLVARLIPTRLGVHDTWQARVLSGERRLSAAHQW